MASTSASGNPQILLQTSEKMRTRTTASDNDILVMQIRAFLEASEDVDLDVETVEDLMQEVPSELDQDIDPEDLGEDDAQSAEENDARENENVTAPHEDELDISALYSIEDEGKILHTRHRNSY